MSCISWKNSNIFTISSFILWICSLTFSLNILLWVQYWEFKGWRFLYLMYVSDWHITSKFHDYITGQDKMNCLVIVFNFVADLESWFWVWGIHWNKDAKKYSRYCKNSLGMVRLRLKSSCTKKATQRLWD